jgi:uracil-DNA glycosylase
MSLEPLLAEIRACRVCADVLPFEPRPVVQASAQTRILISSQAPGRLVHEKGRPFDDPSGDRLRGWMGVDRDTFYGDPRIGVAGMSFCFPGTDPNGADYPPLPRCAPLWRKRLLAELPKVELSLLVGSYALAWTLGRTAKRSMTETVRAWRDFPPGVLPLPHPSWRNTAWLRRNPWFDEELAPYVRQRVAEIIGS